MDMFFTDLALVLSALFGLFFLGCFAYILILVIKWLRNKIE